VNSQGSNALNEPINPTDNIEELIRLSRETEKIHAQLTAFRSSVERSNISFPQGVLFGLSDLTPRLIKVRESVASVEKQRNDLQALAEIGYLVNSSLDVSNVLNEVMDTIIKLTGAERAFLMQRAGSKMVITNARNWERESLKPGEYEISRTVVNQVVKHGEAVLTTNAQEDPRFDAMSSVVTFNLRSILCVPLKVKEELIGVIYADNRMREGIFSEDERSLLSAFANQAAVALENARLFNDISISYDQTLEALVTALEVRERETKMHTRRVVLYSMALAQKMGLSEDQLLELRRGALMHDIGKIGVPDAILNKPGPLSEEEWTQMQRHPELGVDILEGIIFFQGAIDIVGASHEKYDGTGYPLGLKEEQIPLGARIFALADALDALTSDRPYRKAQSFQVAFEEILRCRGTQFEPQVVDAFMSISEEEWRALREITLPRDRDKPSVSGDSKKEATQ
jgi:putative nucleotidyltransferase with HDIG domain